MAQETEIAVRRAKASDAEEIASFLNDAFPERLDLDRVAVLTRLGDVGFFLAEHNAAIVGVLGWQMENLVARVTDFLVQPAAARTMAGEALFTAMESTAADLQGEVVLLFVPRGSSGAIIDFCETMGYDRQTVADLPKMWQEAAYEADYEDGDTVLTKRLRAERVASPL